MRSWVRFIKPRDTCPEELRHSVSDDGHAEDTRGIHDNRHCHGSDLNSHQRFNGVRARLLSASVAISLLRVSPLSYHNLQRSADGLPATPRADRVDTRRIDTGVSKIGI